MDIPTLALAKAYTDSQRLAHVEVKKTALTFDGDITGGNVTQMMEGIFIAKVSDDVFDPADFKGIELTRGEFKIWCAPGISYDEGLPLNMETALQDQRDSDMKQWFIQIEDNPVMLCQIEDVIGDGYSFEKGTYLMWYAAIEDVPIRYSSRVVFQSETIHPIDPKYIPAMDSLTLVSPDGTSYKVTADDSGNLTVTAT